MIYRLVLKTFIRTLEQKHLFSVSKYFGSSTSKMSTKKALVLLSEGSEEMEFVIAADVLRRAGIEVTVAGLQGNGCHIGSRKIKICADVAIEEAINTGPYDAIILPGGLGGAKAFSESAVLGGLLKGQESSGRLIAAICAAPLALLAHGVGLGKKVTCYPSLEQELLNGNKFQYLHDNVVVDGDLITSRGPGTAFEFALAIVSKLLGDKARSDTAKPMLLN